MFLWQLKVVTVLRGMFMEVEELRQENRRELLLEEEQGLFPRRLVFVLFVVTELAPHIK